jgi:hypothetical protein
VTGFDLRTDPRFVGYQADFLHRIASEMHSGSLHLLVAPVGSGKSFAIAGSLVELMRVGCLKRVLVLAPGAMLAAQWTCLVNQMGGDSVTVDSGVFRLMREKIGGVPSAWPQGVYVMSVDLAKRVGVKDLLGAVDWDLVIVDEAHGLSGQRLDFVRGLAGESEGPALLLATHMRNGVCAAISNGAHVIDWNETLNDLRSRVGSPDSSLVRVTKTYHRSEEEAEVARDVLRMARTLGATKGMMLLRRASSSVMALENTLMRWVESPISPSLHAPNIERLLQSVEQLHVDSKLECFKQLIHDLHGGGVEHSVAFTEFMGTIECVAAALDDSDLPIFLLHGGLTSQEHAQILDSFKLQGGLLLTTVAAIKSVEVKLVNAVIHYDLPMSPDAFAVRENQFYNYFREGAGAAYLLQDEVGAYPLDAVLARLVTSATVGSSDVDFDALYAEALLPRDCT